MPQFQPASDPRYYRFARPEIVNLVPVASKSVLDVGCAAGVMGEALKARSACTVVGVEINPEVAAEAATRLDQVICGDISTVELPFIPGHFDCIVCADVLEHLPDPGAALRRLRRLLSDDGCLVCSLPNIAHESVVRGLLAGQWNYVDAGILDRTHLRFFTIHSAIDLFRANGFTVDVPGGSLTPPDAVMDNVWKALVDAQLIDAAVVELARVYQFYLVARKTAAAAEDE